jgi:hypothetical protein
MYGCLASTFSSLPYSLIITLFKPQNFDWNDFLNEKLAFADSSSSVVVSDEAAVQETNDDEPTSRSNPRWLPNMRRWTIIAAIWSAATFLGHWILWPLLMYAVKFTFSKKCEFPQGLFLSGKLLMVILLVLFRMVDYGYYLALGNLIYCRVLPYHRWTVSDSSNLQIS